ncbi:MAG: SGNH/GDSL hydrolase family protein [Pirellulales bacterium]|nr:SGNH/GDSL hydrolase family protein [Pirellulales bacterium]
MSSATRLLPVPVAAVLLGLMSLATEGLAAPSRVIVLGDSLSDGGNAYQFSLDTGNYPDPPDYWPTTGGRFCNGLVWPEYLAAQWGLAIEPSRLVAGGTNLAYGGAQTGSGASWLNTPNLNEQLAGYLQSGATITGSERFIIWAGANDVFDSLWEYAISGDSADLPPTRIPGWVANLCGLVRTLHDEGARDVMLLNLPPLGKTPYFLDPLTTGLLDGWSADFNAALSRGLAELRPDLGGTTVREIDVFALFNEIVEVPEARPRYGLPLDLNVTDPLVDHLSEPGVDPTKYMFWDSAHPTTVIHAALARVIPEPSSMALLLAGAIVAGGRVWRKQRLCSRGEPPLRTPPARPLRR